MIKQENIKNESENVGGAIVEINIKKKNITKINPISNDDITPLANEEKESAKEIVKLEEIVGEIIPKGAEIEKIQSSFPQKARLVDKDDSVQAVPREGNEKRALIHYNLDGKKWVVQVNLDEKKVEEIKYSSDKDDKNKGRDRLIQN